MVHKKIYKTLDELSRDLDLDRKQVTKLHEAGEIIDITYHNSGNTKTQNYFMYIPGVNSRTDIFLFSICLTGIPALFTKFIIYYSDSIISWISIATGGKNIEFLESTFQLFIGLSSFALTIFIGFVWKQEYTTKIKYGGWLGYFIYLLVWCVILFFTLLNLSIDLQNIGK